MNNTINNVSNVNFNSRYLRINDAKEMPARIYETLQQNSALTTFIDAGKPKTMFQKFLDLFKKDEFLDVYYLKCENSKSDPYDITEILNFTFGKNKGNKRFFQIKKSQVGMERQQGSIPKPGEHYKYKPPIKTSENQIIEEIQKIEDFDKELI